MKKYTQEDFNKFEKNDLGYIICPTGDYTEIKEFPAHCSFGKWCSFGEGCTCEDGYGFKDFAQVGYIGSGNDTAQFWLLTDNTIWVRCGCFCGTLDEFVKKVEARHGNNKYAKQYMAAIELAKVRFEKE